MELFSLWAWIGLSLGVCVILKIYIEIRDRIDNFKPTGIKIYNSRKTRIRSILGMLIFSFITTGLAITIFTLFR